MNYDADINVISSIFSSFNELRAEEKQQVLSILKPNEKAKFSRTLVSISFQIEDLRQKKEQQEEEQGIWKRILRKWFPRRKYFNYQVETPSSYLEKIQRPVLVDGITSFSNWYVSLWLFCSTFIGLAIIDNYAFKPRNFPILIGSLGALATLIFALPQSPPAQPRAIFVGTLLSTVIAVSMQKAIGHIIWLAASLALSLSIFVMNMTGTLHPPAGALAVIYVVVPGVQILGYMYIVTSLFGAIVMFFVAVLMNNVMRYNKPYPKYYM